MAPSAAPRLVQKPAIEGVKRLIRGGDLESWDAQKILTWALENFHPRLALSASFGAPEGMVLLDMMHRIDASSRVFVLDTGRLAQATHDLIDRVRERYDKQVEVLFPRADDVQEMVREQGVNLFYESLDKRKLCCRIRKVEPMRRYLATLDAYVTAVVDVEQAAHRVAGARQRFLGKHVQPGPGDGAALQRLRERRLVDDGAAGGVDEAGRRYLARRSESRCQ